MVSLHHCGLDVLSRLWIGLFDMASCLVVSSIPATVEASSDAKVVPNRRVVFVSHHLPGSRYTCGSGSTLRLLGGTFGRPLRLADLLDGET